MVILTTLKHLHSRMRAFCESKNHIMCVLAILLHSLIQLFEDLYDLEKLLKAEQREKNPMSISHKQNMGIGHCSALIKVLPGNADLYTSHDTWSGYNTMLRVIKLYDLPYHTTPHSGTVVASHSVAMSSYPGKLQSEDDYYLCSSGLVS